MKAKICGRVAGAVLIAACVALFISLRVAPYPVSSLDTAQGSWRASDVWLLDRHGAALSRIRVDHERRRGEWVALADVSPALVEMVIASEDKRFREHGGVDWRAIAAALGQTLAGQRRGGSTLTMQLAAHLHPALEQGGRRSVVQKWRQARQALAIERQWRKDAILEAWLNLTPFRGDLEGIDAASRSLFGKRAGGLDRLESALLAALVRSPNAAPTRVARRACALLDREERACLIVQGMAAGGLRGGHRDPDIEGLAPHLARKLVKRPGEHVRSTLDARVQQFARDTLVRHLRELQGRHVEDGAVVVLDNETGEVLAWVGSSGTLSRAHEVDGVMAPRQAGSTLKPFLYALAIERRTLTAASILEDRPVAVTLPAGLYVPQNYDRTFKGSVSLRHALASSLNVPAVRTLALVGYEPFYRQLKNLGFDTLRRDADHYGYSLALGGAEVTLLQLANAYRALANGGQWRAVKTLSGAHVPSVPEHDKEDATTSAIDSRAAFVVSDILADPAARALTFGFASPLATRYRSSVKTGTSKEMRDNWAVGFAGRYTVGVWVGNFSGAPMHDVSGIDGAAPVWREVMDYLQEAATPRHAKPPDGLTRRRIAYSGALEPDRDEWFIAGTETSRIVALEAPAAGPHIESPARGAIYAIDPDIPRDRQRLVLTARGAPRGARFVLDDGREAPAGRALLWLPEPGSREVLLKNAEGEELDRVRFEVRGLRRTR